MPHLVVGRGVDRRAPRWRLSACRPQLRERPCTVVVPPALCSVVGEMADPTDPLLDMLSAGGDAPTSEAQAELLAGMEVYRTLVDSGSPSDAWDAVTSLDEKDARRALLSAVLNEISRRRQPV